MITARCGIERWPLAEAVVDQIRAADTAGEYVFAVGVDEARARFWAGNIVNACGRPQETRRVY